MPFTKYLETIAAQTDKWLERFTPPGEAFPPEIHKAMRYSLFAGGKRVRPLLAVAGCEAVGGRREVAAPFASALEMIHTYTLIHDDLPALDDDELRRGLKTCHMVFGEANAILAGDALLTLAFEVLSDASNFPNTPAETVLRLNHAVAMAIGSRGTIGGQVVDIENEDTQEPNPATLEYIHSHKTGKLITLSVWGGGLLGEAGEDQLAALEEYGRHIGLAFQIIDDILDVEGDEKTLGKKTGADARKNKMTYPAVSGMRASREKVVDLVDRAIGNVSMFGEDGRYLVDIAKYIAARSL